MLNDLILQGGAQGTLPSIGFRNAGTPGRLRSNRSRDGCGDASAGPYLLPHTPRKSLDALVRLCVRRAVACSMFSLVVHLSSMPSAGACVPLFEYFAGVGVNSLFFMTKRLVP